MSQRTVDPVSADELLARFVLSSRWIRADGTVRQDAFLPPADLNLSVTRHGSLSVDAIWSRGKDVAEDRALCLHGRADVLTGRVVHTGLAVQGYPLEKNPEHAHITGWPHEKSAQKSLAQQIAAGATFHRFPSTTPSWDRS